MILLHISDHVQWLITFTNLQVYIMNIDFLEHRMAFYLHVHDITHISC